MKCDFGSKLHCILLDYEVAIDLISITKQTYVVKTTKKLSMQITKRWYRVRF